MSPSQPNPFAEYVAFAARSLAEGRSPGEVVSTLMGRGIPREYAEYILRQASPPAGRFRSEEPLPQKPASSPKAKPRRSPASTCGCLLAIGLLALACISFAVSPELVERTALSAGISAFNRGECREGIRLFQRVLSNHDWGLTEADASAETLRAECLAFLEADDMAVSNQYGNALASYVDFSQLYPRSGLLNNIPSRAEAIFAQASSQQLATEDLCDRLALVMSSQFIPAPANLLPELYYYCGETYAGHAQLENALIMYVLLRTEYPDHPLAIDATRAQAQVEIELARQAGASSIPQPLTSGDAPLGTAVYLARNDSPDRIQIILSGPEVIIDEIAECSTCKEFTSEPDTCPGIGPLARFPLTPGRYQVVVKSITDEGVVPYQGTWSFQSGSKYSRCYYIVTTPKP